MDDVTQNAQNMENTRNDGPPPPDENARGWEYSEADRARDRARMQAYLDSERGGAPARGPQQQQPDAGAQRRAEITKQLITGKLTDAQREALTKELKASIHNDPSNKALAESATLSDHRARFDLDAPGPDVLPSVFQEQYANEWSGHEEDFLAAAAADGLDSKLVREMRDYGIRMAVQAGGQRVSEEQWRNFATTFKGRLSERQLRGVATWWVRSVEGQS